MKPISVYFHIQHLYYLPQFLPIYHVLKQHNIDCQLLFITEHTSIELVEKIATRENLSYLHTDNDKTAIEIYSRHKPAWVVFGNTYEYLTKLPAETKSALLYHGVGIKDCYYDKELADMDVRFVEGSYRYEQIKKRYPNANLLLCGFAKLDPIINNSLDIEKLKRLYKLDPEKKTLLYAPTFYPSSIEKMHINWPDAFSEYNIIIKPHHFSLTKKSYKKQAKLLRHWEGFSNVYLANHDEYSLTPFMAIADILISEASSAMFEFAALNKPVIWCDFVKLRWNYHGIFKYRYNQRMDSDILRYSDIAAHVGRYKNLKSTIINEISNPQTYEAKRKQYTNELLGDNDGETSEKIYDYLIGITNTSRTNQ